jgi:hypothetical protein
MVLEAFFGGGNSCVMDRLNDGSFFQNHCFRVHGSTSYGTGNPFNLHVEFYYNQYKMLWTGIEPKVLCSLERWNLRV